MSGNIGLGKGFDALLPKDFDQSLLKKEGERVEQIAIADLQPNPEQPRQHFEEAAIAGLAESIKRHGVLQPLVVTPHKDKYYVIAGERRWRASKKAGLKTVPAIVRSAQQLERLELALVENVQRVDLSPLEQAASISYLHEQFSLDYGEIAKRLGKALTTVQNIARLLQLSEPAKKALAAKQISEGHARALLSLKEEKQQLALLKLIIDNGWSVRQAERYVVAQKQGAKTTKSAERRVAETTPQTEKLSKALNTKVSVRRMAKGGKLEISFKSDAELKRIISRIR